MYSYLSNRGKFFLLLFSLLFIITCKKDEDSVAFVNASSNNEDQGYVEFSAGDYGIGSSVTFTAVPNEHFVFVQWRGSSGQTYTDNPLTVKIESDLNLVAEFEATSYEFNVTTNGDGRVEQEIISTSARITDIQYGSRVRLTAIPENEHVFFRWGGDISETDNPIEVDVLGSMDITGNFDFELINSLIGNWTFPTTNAQSARGVDSNSNKSNDCTLFGLVFKPDYTFILFYSGGQIDGEFELISNTEISLGNSGSISNIDISETAISFEINLTVGCSTSVSGERDESSDGDSDEEVTSFLEKVDGTYWKTSYTNTDGKEFAKYFKLNDSIPNSYVEILLVDIEESCIKSSFTSDNVSELRQNYINELSFFSSNYIDGENVTTQFVLSDDESLELSETYGILGGGEDRVSLLQSISETEYNEIKESALCGVDGLLPAPTPTDDPAGVISIFSDSYTNVSGLETNPNWNQQTVVTTFEVAEGDSVLKYEGLNYQGTQFDETSVITKTHLHIDYYSDDATELKLFLISPGPKEVSQPLSLENKVLGRWMSADLELASFADVVDLCKVFQIKIEGNGTVYFDNIYFYGDGEGECVEEEPVVIAAGEGPDGPAPTPTDDASDVISIFGDTYTNISDVNMNPSWNQETQYAEVEIADGDKIVRYSNLNYQGIEYAETNVSGKSKLHIDYWTKDATELKFFLIGKTSSGGSTEKSVTIPVSGAGTWKNANIDLSEFNVVVDICKAFQFKIVGNGTVYFDNIYFYGTGSGECQRDAGSPASSAPTPTKDASEVISVYSNAYTDVSVSTFDAAWDANVFDGNFAIGSDNVLKYSALATAGIELPQPSSLDISGKTHVHFDVWTPDNTTINLKLVDYKSDGNWGADNVEHEYTVSNVSQNQWTSVDIALSDFTGLTSKENIGQIIFSTGTEQNRTMATVFIDNIYFYGTADTSGDSSGDSSEGSYCEKTVTHFGIAAETASAIKLSVSKQDANNVKVTIESADNDPVDELVLSGYPGVPITGSPAVSAKDTSVAGKISIVLTWNSTPPDDYEMNILWSKESFAGNWMFTQEDSPVEFKFNSSCGDSSDSGNNQDQGGDNNASSDPAFTEGFGGATISDGVYTFPSGSQSWAGFANKNADLYPFSFPYGGQITFNAATQGTDVAMNFKFEKNPHPDVDPSFSTSNITITGTDVNQYSIDIPVRPQTQTYSSWLMYLITQDAGVSITDIAITVYTELPASEDGSCSINTSLSSGSDSQSMNLGSSITDIVYDITTDCTQIIHLVESTGLPTGVTASIAGTTLTISGTPAGGSSGTYNYSLVIDNHLEETSSAPFVAATASDVISGSITVVDLSTKLTLPINFEDESLIYDFADFDGGNLTRVANPDASGINTSSYVGKMIKGAGATWAGSSYVLENAIDFAEKKFFTMKVWVPKASVEVKLKLESSSGDSPIEVNVTTTQADTWENLTFDFTGVYSSGSYDKLVWIFENGSAGDGSDNFTYYIDDLFQKESASGCSIEVSLETQGTDDQSVDIGSSIDDIEYNIITDCIELIHLVDSTGLPSGVSASITGDILTISGTPASGSSGTYNYSIVVDNHLEETSTDPFRAATVSKVIEGSITVNNEVTFTVEVPDGTTAVIFQSNYFGWSVETTASDNGDGTWSYKISPAPTQDLEYTWWVNGVQENLILAYDSLDQNETNTWVNGTSFNRGNDGNNHWANRMWTVGSLSQTGYYNGYSSANRTSVTFTITVPNADANTSVHFNSTIGNWGSPVTAVPSTTDGNLNGSYTHTISPAPSAEIQYLWQVDSVQETLVDVYTAGCDAFVADTTFKTDGANWANRLWTVGSDDQSGIYNACTDPVTFTVEVPDGTSSVVFHSNIFGWSTETSASDNGDGTWSYTITPAPTQDLEYVWIVDTVKENLIAAYTASCAAFVQDNTFNTDSSTYGNRLWKVGSGDQSGYYNGCSVANRTSVTFTVTVPDADANTSVHFNSTIGNWGSPVTAVPSTTDGNLNGSYTHTISPAPSAEIQYLWQVDSVQETLVDVYTAGCDAFVADTTFKTDGANWANRLWTVGSDDQSGIYDACTDPSEPETAPAAPTADASNVISVFSDAYTDIENTNFSPDWNQATVSSLVTLANNEVNKQAGLTYQGINIGDADGNALNDVSSMEYLHVDYWSADLDGIDFFLIGSGGEVSYNLEVTSKGTWLSADIPLSTFSNATLTEIKQIKTDAQSDANGGPGDVYFDNIYFWREALTEPASAPAAPTADASNVISVFSDAYTDIENTNFSPDWNQATVSSLVTLANNEVNKQAGLTYQGINIGDADGNALNDVSSMEYLHVDYWSADLDGIDFFLIGSGGEVSYNLEVTSKGTWLSADIPLSTFSNATLTEIKQIKTDAQSDANGGPGDVYFDNIYFWREALTEPASAPAAPTADASNVISVFSDAYTDIENTNFSPDWNQATVSSLVTLANNEVNKQAGLTYQGINIGDADGNALNDVSSMEYLHVDYWSADLDGIDFFLIGSGGEVSYNLEVTSKGTWLSADIPLSTFSNATLTEIKQIKTDAQSDANGGPGDVYFDNIYFWKDSTTATEPSASAPAPTVDETKVLSIFSDVYTDVAMTGWKASWSVGGDVEDFTIGNDVIKKYNTLSFAGADLANTADASNMTKIHIDYWTADATEFKFKIVDFGANGVYEENGDNVEHEYVVSSPAQGQWNSLDLSLSDDFTGLTTKAHIAQLVISAGGGTIFIDNIYFYEDSTTVAIVPSFDAFEGASKVGDVYTFPSSAQSYAGFANGNNDIYPFRFPYGGKITFTGSADQDASLRFKFERKPYDAEGNGAASTEPNFYTMGVDIDSSTPTDFSVNIPPYRGDVENDANQTFESLLMYINENDIAVTLTDFEITTYQSQQEADDALAARLIYSDEFNVAGSPDTNKWHHQVIPPNNGTWHNNELQHYTDADANSFVSDGTLKIVAKKESYTYENSTLDYTSARLNSKFVFKYGRVEVRAKTPNGGGTWPAIWTLGANINEVGNFHGDTYGNVGWPHCGELDIMEQLGNDKTKTTSAIHWNEIGGGHVYVSDEKPISNVGSDFHVYSMEWTDSKIAFFVDDVKILEKVNDDTVPFDNEHYLLLNLAIGGQLGGDVPADFTDQTFEIDYVRVYKP